MRVPAVLLLAGFGLALKKVQPLSRRFPQKNVTLLELTQKDQDLNYLTQTGLLDIHLVEALSRIRLSTTLFVPLKSALNALPLDFGLFVGQLDDKLRTSLLFYHVIAPRAVRPDMFPEVPEFSPLQLNSYLKNYTLSLKKVGKKSPLGNYTLVVNDDAEVSCPGCRCQVALGQVTQVIHHSHGWVYKINQVLMPAWNFEPTLEDYLNQRPTYSRISQLLQISDIIVNRNARLGPITVFIFPDDNWAYKDLRFPACIFRAFEDPDNKPMVQSLVRSMALAGLWNITQLMNASSLTTLDGTQLKTERVLFPFSPPKLLIGGAELVHGNIPVHNGLAHVLSSAPPQLAQTLQASAYLWHCVDELCGSCPDIVEGLLGYFDKGGLLPSVEKPLEYLVPTKRPSWVCQGSPDWFPPGWELRNWKKYIKLATSNTPSRAADVGLTNAIEAAKRVQALEETLETAQVKLREIQAYSDWPRSMYPPFWDLKLLLSFILPALPDTVMPQCHAGKISPKPKDAFSIISLKDVLQIADLKMLLENA